MNDERTIQATDDCPYVGLLPFSEEQAKYFFGRESDIEIVATNLRAARLTVLYGSSGVGKSSVIRAGVIPLLERLAKVSTIPGEPPDFLPVVVREWVSNPLQSIRKGLRETVEKAVLEGAIPDVSATDVLNTAEANEGNDDLCALIKSWTDLVGTKVLFIFDQFEDFFLHPDFFSGKGSFGEEFPKAVTDATVPAHFLLSLRDDSLSKLDFFKGRIQGAMNTLRLRHLSRALARQAITGPIEKYNGERHTGFQIEEGLIDQILDDVRVGKVKLESQGQANVEAAEAVNADNNADQIETPYLQLVLQRLWKDDNTQTTRQLTLDTLVNKDKLGGVQKIVETHLEDIMKQFEPTEQQLISEFIHFTVTRSGAKIPSDAEGLADWAELPKRKDDIAHILDRLSIGEHRIFKNVENLHDKNRRYYEVAHDALAPAILSWRARYIDRTRTSQIERVIKWWAWRIVPVILLIGLGLLALGAYNYSDALHYFDREKKAASSLSAKDELIQEQEIEIMNLDEKQRSREEQFTALVGALSKLVKGSEREKDAALDKLKQMDEQEQIPSEAKQTIVDLISSVTSSEKGANVKKALLESSSIASQKPRIMIHYVKDLQSDGAQEVQNRLKNQFDVPSIEIRDVTMKKTQVRYFRQSDAAAADRIENMLESYGIQRVDKLYLRGYENSIPPNQLEIWFAEDTFAQEARVADTVASHLLLRSGPDTKNKIVARIPSGEIVLQQLCQPDVVEIDGNRGKWCQVTYNSQAGWVFNKFLTYY